MKKIIINADDFGYSSAVNAGILKSFKYGVLTSATLMANMPGRDEAINIAKKTPNLGVGAHLVLTCGKPLTSAVSLIKRDGYFFSLAEYKLNRRQISENEIFEEWCAQIDYLLNKGIALTHLDSHHHLHAFEENHAITFEIAKKYKLCFRNILGLENKTKLPFQKKIQGCLDLMDHQEIRNVRNSFSKNKEICISEILSSLSSINDNDIIEFMVHPAFIDETIFYNSSFNLQRMKEVEILCASELNELLEHNNFITCHYGTI